MTISVSAACSNFICTFCLLVPGDEKATPTPTPTNPETQTNILSASPPPVALGATIILVTIAGAMYRHYSQRNHSTLKQKKKNEEYKQSAGKAFVFALITFSLQAISTAGLFNTCVNIGLVLSFIIMSWYFSRLVLD